MQVSRHPVGTAGHRAFGSMAGTAAIALVGCFALPALAADTVPGTTTDAANARYISDRAACDAGKTTEDRATCLKEAGAAQADRKRHQLDNKGSPAQNGTDRCNLLPAKDKADCLTRVQGPAASNETVTKSGSVAGGGVLKETTTTTTGPAIVVPVPATAASASR